MQSMVLGQKYKELKAAGAESVTGFNLYETPAYAIFNAERAARKKVEVQLRGTDKGYAVDKMSAAMSHVREQLEFEEETSLMDDEESGESGEPVDFADELSKVARGEDASDKTAKAQETDLADLLADFVNPDEKDN
ncbi:hypothetical protein DIPPA_35025 [Diplonema papillatum]|nr:hypothetical protein DIPPA_35025 [Diplonema papillatum]